MVFNAASVKSGGSEVSAFFKTVQSDARDTGKSVTKSLNIPTDALLKNLREVDAAIKRINDTSKSGNFAAILKAVEAASRAEVEAAQKASREKEKLAGDDIKRAQKVADAESREAARMEREK